MTKPCSSIWTGHGLAAILTVGGLFLPGIPQHAIAQANQPTGTVQAVPATGVPTSATETNTQSLQNIDEALRSVAGQFAVPADAIARAITDYNRAPGYTTGIAVLKESAEAGFLGSRLSAVLADTAMKAATIGERQSDIIDQAVGTLDKAYHAALSRGNAIGSASQTADAAIADLQQRLQEATALPVAEQQIVATVLQAARLGHGLKSYNTWATGEMENVSRQLRDVAQRTHDKVQQYQGFASRVRTAGLNLKLQAVELQAVANAWSTTGQLQQWDGVNGQLADTMSTLAQEIDNLVTQGPPAVTMTRLAKPVDTGSALLQQLRDSQMGQNPALDSTRSLHP